jgi:hypothetical protein
MRGDFSKCVLTPDVGHTTFNARELEKFITHHPTCVSVLVAAGSALWMPTPNVSPIVLSVPGGSEDSRMQQSNDGLVWWAH